MSVTNAALPHPGASRRSRWTAPLAVLALALSALSLGTSPASAESTTITQGSVTWGVKQSWRNYIGESGISVAGGVTRAVNGAFVWPVETGTYDSETKKLELQLKGSTHFTAHEGALDMTITNPRLVVDGDDPQVFAEVVSKSESTGQLVDFGEIPLVSLDLASGAPETVSGTTTWTPMSSSLTPEGFDAFSRNYPTGTVMDPVSATYTGPGGKPAAVAEVFAAPGSLTYEQTGSQAISPAVAILPDPARGLVHVSTLTSLTAYDSTTWQPVGTPLAVNNGNYPNAILDPDVGAVILNLNNKVSAYRWNTATKSYDTTVLLDGNPQAYSYDRFAKRILVPDSTTGLRVFTWTDGAYVQKVFPLSGVPSGRAGITADAKGKIVVVAANFTPVVITVSGNNASLAQLPGDYSNPSASQAQFQYPSDVFAPSTGGFFLTNYQGNIFRVREAGGVYTRDAVVRKTGLGAVLRTTPDLSTDTWYLADNTLQTVTAVTDTATGVFKVKDLGYFVISPIGIGAANGKVYVAASALSGSNEDYGIRTFEKVGTAGTFTTQPQNTTATIGVGESSDEVTFTAAAAGDPAVTLQWQSRPAATGKFVDVAGATGTSLDVNATASVHGRQYRVLATNAAGTVVSDVVTLTVVAAPTIVIDLADKAVQAGDDALLEVMPAGNPYPSITWQRRVGGYWQDIAAGDDNFVVDGGKLTVLDTNVEQSGTLFRARLANAVATIYSRVATLGVEAPTTAKQLIDAGQLDWGVKKSFRDYVVGSIAHGEISVSGGAVKNADGTFRFAVDEGTYDPTTKTTEVDFDGTVRFVGHDGALELVVTDPAVSVTGATGTLTADVTSKSLESGQSVAYGRVAVADLDTSSGVTVGGGTVTLAGVPATLTAAGAPAFAGFYPAGTALDALGASLALGAEVGVDAPSTTTVRAARSSFAFGATTTVAVKVASPAGTPSGAVQVTVGGRKLSAVLSGGAATVRLPAGLTPGEYPVTATYPGSAGTAGSTSSTKVTVSKATPRLTATLAKKTIKKSTRVKLRIVAAIPSATPGIHPVGQVVVRDGSRIIAVTTLKASAKGVVTVKLPKLKKGKHFISVTVKGNSNQATVKSAYRVLRVR